MKITILFTIIMCLALSVSACGSKTMPMPMVQEGATA